ncbi:MAG: phosphatase PAP2 family protein [Verrucomicrobia bacterium]|nr:phosphatase PAP2 family protein [Verrucomicrobiota bacterium]MCH8510098.1 phosphatase PAP2 family protein [Kiritimatiellia bacterium]
MTFTALFERCAAGDRTLFLRLAPPRTSVLGRAWNRVASRLADGPYYVLPPLVAWWVGAPGAVGFAICLAMGFALELPAYKWIKHTCKRPRPCHADLDRINLLPVPDQYSFPSGHTAGAFVLAGSVLGFYPVFAPWAILFALSVGYSRVYNRLHFPLDILAGALLGGFCAAVAGSLFTLISGGLS